MASQQTSVHQSTEMYKAGQRVQYSGEYNVLDEQANPQGQDQITLDEGDTFPQIDGINAYYRMNATCMEEECEVMGGETPETE
jgi:hypothetical protein